MHERSPWLDDLNRTRTATKFTDSHDTDVLVVGGGIAGISTCYYILAHTKLNVTLVEANLVAHGATGHNAGQMVAYFETPLHQLAQVHGQKKVLKAKEDVVTGWKLIKDIYKTAHLKTPCRVFKGATGFTSLPAITNRLAELHFQKSAHIPQEPLLIAQDSSVSLRLPSEYKPFYRLVPHQKILSLLHTNNPDFIAVNLSRRGVLNSARFTEELATYLLHYYPDRFKLFEHSPVHQLKLYKNYQLAKINTSTLTAKYTVLCTNGYEYLNIVNLSGKKIIPLKKRIIQTVGFMSAYTYSSLNKSPHIHIYRDVVHPDKDDYYYLTKRSFMGKQLVCLGGGYELVLKNKSYTPLSHYNYPQEADENLRQFLSKNYLPYIRHPHPFEYRWHGVMGYTQNGIRLIGNEPRNPRLLYNLGCNGTGILHSLYGAKKISQLLLGKRLAKSIFDPT